MALVVGSRRRRSARPLTGRRHLRDSGYGGAPFGVLQLLVASLSSSVRSSGCLLVLLTTTTTTSEAWDMRRCTAAWGRSLCRRPTGGGGSRPFPPPSYDGSIRSPFSTSRSSSSSNYDDVDAFIVKQTQMSGPHTTPLATESVFREHQKKVFDGLAEYFATGQTVPTALVPVYQYLARYILSSAMLQKNTKKRGPENEVVDDGDDNGVTVLRILDVACGAGVLWPYLAAVASQGGVQLQVTGVDLSPHMVQAAAATAATLVDASAPIRHTFAAIESDILSYPPAMTTGDGSSSSSSSEGTYDLIVANACFGNFWNQTAVLAHCANRLRTGGSCVVSHPLGADFVARLHEEDPATVPHLLPTSVATWNDLTWTLPFQRTSFVHPTVPMADGTVVPFYACTLQKVRARALSHLVRLRGAVDAGYGRGGKQLGFPTANLPSRLFQTALVDVATGVYFGWAVLERDDNDNQNGGRNSTTTTTVHKAVVNVGYSPTFAGRENLEKIVEAHLMLEDDDNDLGDFYGATMRLLLTGYLRPEIKFPSLAALVAQIQQDVTEAKAALANEPHATLRSDPFLIDDGTTWVSASGGGDNVASWESQDIRSALDAVVVP